MTERHKIYTDGACSGNPGPGGWAWISTSGQFASGFAAHTTNQRMEVEVTGSSFINTGAGDSQRFYLWGTVSETNGGKDG